MGHTSSRRWAAPIAQMSRCLAVCHAYDNRLLTSLFPRVSNYLDSVVAHTAKQLIYIMHLYFKNDALCLTT
jgi:hypothetical protein